MADNLTATQRRRCMSRNKGRDTGPELRLRKALWAKGLRYRLRTKLPGKPDIVFLKAKLAIFVDGCFWHGCPIHGSLPKENPYWAEKISRNKVRDAEVSIRLEAYGWHLLRFWEHEVSDDLGQCVARAIAALEEVGKCGASQGE